MDMTPPRFFVANLLSALVWAPAYLLPGIVFGASLELAAEAAVRLVLVALILLLAVWIAAWAVQQLFILFSPRAGRWVEGLLRWAEVHPHMGEVARALADPNHPDARTLTALAAVLLMASVLFTLIAGIALAGGDDLAINRFARDLALSLQAPGANHLMAAASRFADLSVTVPLLLAVYIWLRAQKRQRHANYWLGAGAFAVLAGPMVELLLGLPRLVIASTEAAAWTFPSDHTLRATVAYGFLAVSIAGCVSPTWRWLPYVWATAITVSVGLSRLYFGAAWLTDVIGSLALGLAWMAALGLSFRRHTHMAASWLGLGIVSVSTIVAAYAFSSFYGHAPDLAPHPTPPPTITMTRTEWQEGGWKRLPQEREDLRRQNARPMNLQYAGDLDDLARTLSTVGWRRGESLDFRSGIKLFSPSLPLRDLPVIPHVHDGRHEAFALVRDLSDYRRQVLRLWPSHFRLDAGTPIWAGNVTQQEKTVILGLFAVPATDRDAAGPIDSIEQELAALDPVYPQKNAPLLLSGKGE